MSENITVLLPCPFCGGQSLLENTWSIHGEEVDAIECEDCYGGGLEDKWNQRAPQETQQ